MILYVVTCVDEQLDIVEQYVETTLDHAASRLWDLYHTKLSELTPDDESQESVIDERYFFEADSACIVFDNATHELKWHIVKLEA